MTDDEINQPTPHCRLEFEWWASPRKFSIEKDESGEYIATSTKNLWEKWQLDRANGGDQWL